MCTCWACNDTVVAVTCLTPRHKAVCCAARAEQEPLAVLWGVQAACTYRQRGTDKNAVHWLRRCSSMLLCLLLHMPLNTRTVASPSEYLGRVTWQLMPAVVARQASSVPTQPSIPVQPPTAAFAATRVHTLVLSLFDATETSADAITGDKRRWPVKATVCACSLAVAGNI